MEGRRGAGRSEELSRPSRELKVEQVERWGSGSNSSNECAGEEGSQTRHE
jgi:hypothetical protein